MGNKMASNKRFGFWMDLRDALGLRRRPVAVAQVEVTSVCPNRCGYCPRTALEGHWKSRHMRSETFARLRPLFRESGRVHLQGWGEPLDHPDFLDMVAVAREAGCSVSTTTSGRRMTRDLAEALVESGLDVIAFSLAGTTGGTNDSLRAGTPFERVLESIRVLQEVRRGRGGVHLEIHIAYLLLASRIGDLGRLPGLMRELGVHATVVSTLDGSLVPGWRGECFDPEDREKVLEACRELESAAAQARSLGLDVHFSLPEPEPTGRCFEDAERSVFIDAEGNMAPCVHLNLPTTLDDPRRRVFGSCLTSDPMAVWNSEPFAAFRAALAADCPDISCLNCLKRFSRGNNS
jgi:MoaA/NifB/PqqE/SkfB family radical SAM enzyme